MTTNAHAASPPIEAFLKACDQVLNSNTFLVPLGPRALGDDGTAFAGLAPFVRSEAFKDALIAADRARGWMNYGEMDWDTGEYERLHHTGHFVRPGFELTGEALGRGALVAQLTALLTGWSPYHKALTPDVAEPLAEAFVTAVLSESDADGDLGQWHFAELRPDFLHSTGYYDTATRDAATDDFAYFDGGRADHCFVLAGPTRGVMLLTNGSA